MRLGVPAMAMVSLLVAAPAAAEDDLAPGNAATQALLGALDKGVAADVVAALAAKVKIDGAVFADQACAKAFGGTRTVRGGKRTRLAECLIAAWKAKPSASEPVVAAGGKGWSATLDVGADHYVVGFAAAKGGAAKVAAITVNGGAPKPEKNEDPPKLGVFFKDKNRRYLEAILERDTSTSLSKFQGIKGSDTGAGMGTGTGTGVGEGVGTTARGKGTGAGGTAAGDFVTTGKGPGPRDVSVTLDDAGGDFGGYTADEIHRVVKARAGIFRACYQKELNRTPGLTGKVVIDFTIAEDGTVARSAVKSTTMNNENVELCIRRNIERLRFPAKGTRANVTYPFVFSSESG
jgi:hypothetical protein